MSVPDDILDKLFEKALDMDLSPIEESKSLSDSFTVDGIEYLADGEVSAKFDQNAMMKAQTVGLLQN